MPPTIIVETETSIQSTDIVEDLKNKDYNILISNDDLSQIENSLNSQTNNEIELAEKNSSYSKLIDRCLDYLRTHIYS